MPVVRPSVVRPFDCRWLAPCGVLVFALTLISPKAAVGQAQLTNKSLIGYAVSQPDSSKYSDVSEAIRRFNNRDLPGAKLLLEQARRKHPKLPPVAVMLAKMYAITGNSAAVRPALEQSIVEDADDPEPYLLLAEDALTGNRTIEADALFDKAVSLIEPFDSNPKRKRSFVIRAYKGRAVVSQRRRKWSESEADLRVWLEEDPENATAHGQLGSVLIMLDRNDEGLRAFEEARKLNDQLPNPFVTAGVVLQRRGDGADALEYFRRAYREDDKNETNITQYANSLVITGDLREAKKVLQNGIRELPESFNLWLLSGVVARMGDDNARAESFFQKALSIQPSSRDALLQISYVLADSEDEAERQRGQQYAVMNARLNDKNPDAQVALAWALEQGGRPREAAATLGKALQLGSSSSDGQVLVAKMLLARDRQDSAKQVLTSAIARAQGIFVTRDEADELLAKLP